LIDGIIDRDEQGGRSRELSRRIRIGDLAAGEPVKETTRTRRIMWS